MYSWMYSSSIDRLFYAKRPLHCAKQQFPFCFPSPSYQAELELDTHLQNNQLALPWFRFNKIVANYKIFPFCLYSVLSRFVSDTLSLRCKDESRGYETVSGALLEMIVPYSTELSLLEFLCVHSNGRVEQTMQAWRKTWKKSLITGSLLFTALRISFSIHCSASSSLTTNLAEFEILYFPSGMNLRRTAYPGRSQSHQFHCLVAAQTTHRTACGFSE